MTPLGTALTSIASLPVRRTADRQARLYDDEVHPLFGLRFAEMLLRSASLRPRSSVLEVGCAAGAVSAELAHRLDAESRVIAVDASAPLLELARARVRGLDQLGRRLFFRTHAAGARLPFAEETFDVVLGNAAVVEPADPTAFVADLARVARPGGQVSLAVPLRGSWSEFLDLFRDTLAARRPDALPRLDAHLAAQPDADTAARWLEAAGLRSVEVELDHWELVFKSAREFFYAPVIELGPLPRWKEIAGRGDGMHDAFLAAKEAIDTYFAGRAFSVSVFGGRFSARKPARP